MRSALCLILLVPLVAGLPIKKEAVCGYQSCTNVKPGSLNVHVVPHTHDDVGWLKTVDQYYYGSQNGIQKAGVQYILDSVVTELLHDPARRFIYVETSFLMKWWAELTDERRQEAQELIDSGRLEIIGGGWAMNDEAAAHYHSIVDQFAWGLRKLNDTFGRCARPHVGWQIDPFGHSREMASLLSQMGYDGLFLGRLDYQDKNNRLKTKTTELLWEASANLGDAANMYTHSLYSTYGPPPGFCFDVLCGDDPIIDDKRSPDYNVDSRIDDFLKFIEEQAQYYNSDNIILTMGGDFNYQDAAMWYKNLDKVIEYVNARQEGSRVNAFYSTPGCYLKAVNDAGLTLSEKQDDFFPYASDEHAFWTGYFTSRPTSKYFERQGNNFLQVCKQLNSLARLQESDDENIVVLREAMGIMQHHDAITGTEKQAVAFDYGRILSEGFEACGNVVQNAVSKLASTADEVQFSSCLLRNVSQCEVSEKEDSFVVTLYNPQSRAVTYNVRLPVLGDHYSVRDPQGEEQVVQLVPIPSTVLGIPERSSEATSELVFQATNLPPLGFRSYYVTKLENSGPKQSPTKLSDVLAIKNENLEVLVDADSGLVKSIVKNGVEIPLEQSFSYYQGMNGDNHDTEHRASGAYIFRPNGSEPIPIGKVVDVKVYNGDLVDEIHQTFSDWVSQVVRVYKGENHVEFEWLVGPIPVEDEVGKEVISRFTTELASNKEFFTDTNGRELILRTRDFRPTWDLEVTEPQAGNYYPVTSRIVVKDAAAKQEIAVIIDRAQGGSSLNDGQIELMIHRRLLHDDAFGVGEALNEQAFDRGLVARGQHLLLLGAAGGDGEVSLAAEERQLAQQKVLSTWMLLSPAGGKSYEQWADTYSMEYSGLQEALPPNVQILTLEPWKGDTVLLRLEHILEKGDDENLSKPVTVTLESLFSQFTVSGARETTLDGSQWLDETERLQWTSAPKPFKPLDEAQTVELTPMQIRTFVLSLSPKA